MNTVLLVEDSAESFELVRRALGSSVKIDWVKTLAEATRRLEKQAPNLVLLDVMLPDGEGYGLCAHLQSKDHLRGIPVILLTAKSTLADKVMGFSVGADDYVCKPFDAVELRTRVLAKLRRAGEKKLRSKILQIAGLEIDKDARKVFIVENDRPEEIDLTPIEFKILLYFAHRPEKVINRDEVLNAIWGENVYVYGRSVDTHVSKLRKKLGSHAGCIMSVHGAGYRFVSMDRRVSALNLESESMLPLSHHTTF